MPWIKTLSTTRGKQQQVKLAATRLFLLGGLFCVGLAANGCASLEEDLSWGGSATPEGRREFLDELSVVVGELRPNDPTASNDRAQIDRFLTDRFFGIDGAAETAERDVVARSQLISLAVQGSFPSTPRLIEAALTQEEHASVRHIAVKVLREVETPSRQQLLMSTLRKDKDPFVRIDAVKVIAAVGDVSWARPVVEVIVDPSENSSLRFQAHRTANKLLGTDYPFLPSKWKAWLETN